MEINIQVPKKRNLFVNYIDDEPIKTNVYQHEFLELNLSTTKSREHSCCWWLKGQEQDLNNILSDFEPLVNSIDIDITLYDIGYGTKFNAQIGEPSYATLYDQEQKAKIRLNLGDVASLGHELAHVMDMSNRTIQSETPEFQNIVDYVTPKMAKVYEILRDDDYVFFDTSVKQEQYESSPCELYATIVNDYYKRTHDTNIFTDSKHPSLSEVVVNYLYCNDAEYANMIDNYLQPETHWSEPHTSSTCHFSLMEQDEYDSLQEALDEMAKLEQLFRKERGEPHL